MQIPQAFIDDLLARTDIVDVISHRVRLKKAGKEYTSCCPFHNEKTPSFTVIPDKQFYHCFGCGASGNAITFIMEHDKTSFLETVEELASAAGMEVPKSAAQTTAPKDNIKPLYDILEKASAYYQKQLREHRSSESVKSYLKDRGMTGETAKRFGIGYAPFEKDGFMSTLDGSKDTLSLLIKSGIVAESEDRGHYERFRGRVIFPIRDKRGRVIGFGGRVLGDAKPKYLNSPETDVFHKGKELYGLYEAIQSNKKIDHIMVVEGYMDVVMLAQHGIDYSVAALGTATSADHIQSLFRTVDKITFCFDGDRAGRAAAWKALETSLPLMRDGKDIRFMFLPESEDPDSLVRKIGKDAFESMIREESVSISKFLFKGISEGLDITSLSGKAAMIEKSKPLILSMGNGIFKELIIKELSEISGLSDVIISEKIFGAGRSEAKKFQPKKIWNKNFNKHKKQAGVLGVDPEKHYAPLSADERIVKQSPQRTAIAILMTHTDLASKISLPEGLVSSNISGVDLLYRLSKFLTINPGLTTGQIIQAWDNDGERSILSRLALMPVIGSIDQIKEELEDIISSLAQKSREQRLAQLRTKSVSELTEDDKSELLSLMSKAK